ncbi:MAG: VOC family protein [Thiogranum sp.]
MSRFLQIHHASVIVAELASSLAFYVDVLGMELDDTRPELGFNGAWLKAGAQQIHLLEVPNPDPVAGRPVHAGRDRHTALLVTGLEQLVQRLETADVCFTRSRSGRRAVFCRDPDGNAVELIEADREPQGDAVETGVTTPVP